jgi:hypothetical protein
MTKVGLISANRVIDDIVVTASEVVVDVNVEKPLEDENIATLIEVVLEEGDDVNSEPAREASIMASPQSIICTNLGPTKNGNNMLMHNSRLGMMEAYRKLMQLVEKMCSMIFLGRCKMSNDQQVQAKWWKFLILRSLQRLQSFLIP